MKQLFIFTAQWCSKCQSLKKIIQDNEIPVDQLRMFDTEASPKLAREFGIEELPTLILIENGSELGRQSGAVTKTQLFNFINQ